MSRLEFRAIASTVTPAQTSLADLLRDRPLFAGQIPCGESAKLTLIFDDDAWMDTWAGATRDTGREHVGVLYGTVGRDQEQTFLHITHSFIASGTKGSKVDVTLDADAWREIHGQVQASGLDPAVHMVGWWHTHPNLGAFFSGTDRSTQAAAFQKPWNVGVVIDPVRIELAIFSGAESSEVKTPPMVLGPKGQGRVEVPHAAVLLPITTIAGDLGTAALAALAAARTGARLYPLDSPSAGSTGLLFDRPALKRRFPFAERHLRSNARREEAFEVALPLSISDVVAFRWRGLFRPRNELFLRRLP